jgi:alkanesulfonate monooxygenase SsuD/methylene tetrahydromethanopterin reductase-like flavin-dependent oxidoreductase (luciferase family)
MAEVYQDLLDQIGLADELGYDSIWLTEHHFVEDGYTPSPVLMAAIAARTQRAEISTDILILPCTTP